MTRAAVSRECGGGLEGETHRVLQARHHGKNLLQRESGNHGIVGDCRRVLRALPYNPVAPAPALAFAPPITVARKIVFAFWVRLSKREFFGCARDAGKDRRKIDAVPSNVNVL